MSRRGLLCILCIIICCKPGHAANHTNNGTNNVNETFIVEEEDITISHKELFEQQLSKHGLHDLYLKLDANGLMDNDLILFLDDTEIDELCADVKLSKVDIFKFKSIIRKMRHDNVIEISSIEQQAFQQINTHLIDTTEIENILKTYTISDINNTAKLLNHEIDRKFDKIIEKLKTEKQALHQQINDWKSNKIEILKAESNDINNYNNILQHFKRDWIESIQRDPFITRDERDIQIKKNITEMMNMYDSKFIDKNLYLTNYAFSISDIINLSDNIECNHHIKVDMNKLAIPISLDEPIVIDTVNTVYKVILRYKIHNDIDNKCDHDVNQNQIHFMYKVIDDAQWKELHVGEIDHCQVTVNDLFRYNKTYQFQVQYLMDYSIQYKIESNIQEFVIENMAENIPLEYHSHFGNHIDVYHHPKYLVESNNNYLYSSLINSSINDHDWIIFKFKSKHKLYLPTKVYLRNANNDKGITSINMLIGDVETNQWFALEPNDLIIKQVEEKQDFVILSAEKSMIQQKGYQYIKLVMRNDVMSSGYVWYSFYEFGIDGIEIGELENEYDLIDGEDGKDEEEDMLIMDDEEVNEKGSYFTVSGIATAIGGILLLLCLWNIFTEMNDKHND